MYSTLQKDWVIKVLKLKLQAYQSKNCILLYPYTILAIIV